MVGAVQAKLRELLLGANASRSFYTQAALYLPLYLPISPLYLAQLLHAGRAAWLGFGLGWG